MSIFTGVKKLITNNYKINKIIFMNNHITEENKKDELWFDWLTRKLNSFEAFNEFALGYKPKDVAEKFISDNRSAITKLFERFDDEDKDTLEQFQKLSECEWHVFQILKKHLASINKVRYVDFKKEKKKI